MYLIHASREEAIKASGIFTEQLVDGLDDSILTILKTLVQILLENCP